MKFPIISSLALLLAQSKTFNEDFSYEPNFKTGFLPSNAFPISSSSKKLKEEDKAIFGALKQATSTILTPTRSIDSLFLRLPSST